MAKLTGSDAADTAFTPAVGPFRVQVSGGQATIESRADGTAPWVHLCVINRTEHRFPNEVAGTQYRFTQPTTGGAFRADQ